jgi:hypothetical protein
MPAVNGVGKPCAGEPHARFDGGRLETEHAMDGRDEKRGGNHADKGTGPCA